jgi:hypothetical protein
VQNVLFTYRRKVKTPDESDHVFNDNFINPLNVISFYWSVNDDSKRILSVWLVNNYSIVFSEQTGERFVQHMEDFLRYMLGARITDSSTTVSPRQRGEKRTRVPISTDVVEEEPVPAGTSQWQG